MGFIFLVNTTFLFYNKRKNQRGRSMQEFVWQDLEIEEKIQLKKDLETLDQIGHTPLIHACITGNLELVKKLVQANVDVNHVSKSEITPLMHATLHGNEDIVDLLITSGAEIEARSKKGKTAIMLASEKGDYKIVKTLVERGADVHVKDDDGCTTLMKAAYVGSEETVKLLLSCGVEMNIRDRFNYTALKWGVHWSTIAELFVENGVDLNEVFELKSCKENLKLEKYSFLVNHIKENLDKLNEESMKKWKAYRLYAMFS